MQNVIKRSYVFNASLIAPGIEPGEFRECNPHYVARSFLTPMVFSSIWKNSLAPFAQVYDTNEFLTL